MPDDENWTFSDINLRINVTDITELFYFFSKYPKLALLPTPNVNKSAYTFEFVKVTLNYR